MIQFIISSLLGFLSGLGVGGGSLLMIYLTSRYSYRDARMLNLLFFIPAALISCFFHLQRGNLSLKKTAPAILAGTVSAAIFSAVAGLAEGEILRKIFGGILIITGCKELYYRPRNAR